MVILKYTGVTEFASDLRHKPKLAIMAGFEPYNTPAVGTFYNFINRLEDGPFQPSCPHRVLPSEKRKGKHKRNLKEEKEKREEKRKEILEKCDSITEHLKEELLAALNQPRPNDFLSRLEDIFFKVALLPSASRGLLGNLSSMIVSGDGSALETGASPYGKPTCDCRSRGIYTCDHDRYYSDMTANWGWDSYRERYYFGHTFYQHTVSVSGHDLPIHIMMGPASETDFTLSMKSLDRFRKAARELGLPIKIKAISYDAGHDALGIYEFHAALEISSVIALNPRTGEHPNPTGTAHVVNSEGIPICPAGLLMRCCGALPSRHRITYNCPVKRPTHRDGKLIFVAHEEECPQGVLCQKDTKMGPVVYVRSDQDPRFYPKIPRQSAEYKRLMNLRSGCERSNSTKKTVHHLDRRPCRSDTHFLFRLYLIAIIEHAKAWLCEDKKKVGEDFEALLKVA